MCIYGNYLLSETNMKCTLINENNKKCELLAKRGLHLRFSKRTHNSNVHYGNVPYGNVHYVNIILNDIFIYKSNNKIMQPPSCVVPTNIF